MYALPIARAKNGEEHNYEQKSYLVDALTCIEEAQHFPLEEGGRGQDVQGYNT